MSTKTRKRHHGRLGAFLAVTVTAVLVTACTGTGGLETSEGETLERVREIEALVQAGDVDEARLRFDEPHRLLHTTASRLASDEPELSQELDGITEDLQRVLLRSEVDPTAVSEVVGRLLELLAQAGER